MVVLWSLFGLVWLFSCYEGNEVYEGSFFHDRNFVMKMKVKVMLFILVNGVLM